MIIGLIQIVPISSLRTGKVFTVLKNINFKNGRLFSNLNRDWFWMNQLKLFQTSKESMKKDSVPKFKAHNLHRHLKMIKSLLPLKHNPLSNLSVKPSLNSKSSKLKEYKKKIVSWNKKLTIYLSVSKKHKLSLIS